MTAEVDSQMEESPRFTLERETALRRFLDLAYIDKLWLWERIKESMPLADGAVPELDRKLSERWATLVAMRRVTAHLDLSRPPTVAEYDASRERLELGWSSAGIIRLWGRWSEATAAAAGERRRTTVAERAHRRAHLRPNLHNREEPLAAVRMWLRSGSPSFLAVDYDAWAREHNLALEQGGLAMPRAESLKARLALGWSEVLAVARGDKTHVEVIARREFGDWSRGPHDLIGKRTIAHMLGISQAAALRKTHATRFPAPVLVFDSGRRAWLREDIEAYGRGECVQQRANELRQLYLESNELPGLLGVSGSSVLQHHYLPVAGRVAGQLYWLRDEVESWVSGNERLIAMRRAKRAKPGTTRARPYREFVSTPDLRLMLGATSVIAVALARDPRFPQSVAEFGDGRVWLRSDVEAFMTDQSFPLREENALQDALIDAGALAEMLFITEPSVQTPAGTAPPPHGYAGSRRFWVRAEVERWLDEDPRRRQRVEARRRKREGAS